MHFLLVKMVAQDNIFGNWGEIDTRFAKMHMEGGLDTMG